MPFPSRRRIGRRLAGIGVCVAALTSAGALQVEAQTAHAAARPQLPAVEGPPSAGTAFLGGKGLDALSVDTLVGAEVVGSSGRSLGKVTDVVFDGAGRLQRLVIATGGFLGIGEENAVVAWDPARMRMQGPYLVTSLSRTQLERAPDRTEP